FGLSSSPYSPPPLSSLWLLIEPPDGGFGALRIRSKDGAACSPFAQKEPLRGAGKDEGDLGLHTWQRMYGCELWRNGSKGGFLQYGYEGRTFITFDKETLTWVAAEPQAQITQRKWDALPQDNHRVKSYLEEECIEWLEKYLSYRNETLQSTEPPEVTVRGKTEVEDGMETHVCRLDGFYPREINASWTRDGEVWEEETFHGSLAPNADGTYHSWLSIRIDPKERGRYRCHVEHDGLQEPLDLALEEPTNSESNLMFIIIGCVVAVLVLAWKQPQFSSPLAVETPSMKREE
ncbi:putative MHC class I antigen protein, partial [Naja naja]